jgi:hypothetical protein
MKLKVNHCPDAGAVSSEMLVNTYQITQCHIPEDSHLHHQIGQ